MNRLSLKAGQEPVGTLTVIGKGGSPNDAKEFDEFAQRRECPACQKRGEAEENLGQADEDGGKRLDEPEDEENFKKDNHRWVKEWN